MRILILSDIHGNSNALKAVLEHAKDGATNQPGYEAVWCLGDLVGYGPDPNECIELVSSFPDLLCLIGNHDQAALGLTPLARFNYEARSAAAWTKDQLSKESRDFLRSLPSEITIADYTLTHGSPRQPVWEYILDPQTADANFDFFKTDYCLVGHTHLPLIFEKREVDPFTMPLPVPWGELLSMSPRMILNPGSVGQPRDMDPRAAYAILDLETKTWEPRRAEYDVKEVQTRMLEAGLPERQALRLLAGW
jgi:predicted phosphodiesterase